MGLVALLVEKMKKVKEEKNMRDRYSMICPRAPLTGACKTLWGWLGGTRPIEVACGRDLRGSIPLVHPPERTGFLEAQLPKL